MHKTHDTIIIILKMFIQVSLVSIEVNEIVIMFSQVDISKQLNSW